MVGPHFLAHHGSRRSRHWIASHWSRQLLPHWWSTNGSRAWNHFVAFSEFFKEAHWRGASPVSPKQNDQESEAPISCRAERRSHLRLRRCQYFCIHQRSDQLLQGPQAALVGLVVVSGSSIDRGHCWLHHVTAQFLQHAQLQLLVVQIHELYQLQELVRSRVSNDDKYDISSKFWSNICADKSSKVDAMS